VWGTSSFVSALDYGSRFSRIGGTTDLADQGNLRDDGIGPKFDRALPELDTYLESQLADWREQ
jgi:hypothetical protein